jgi:O-methyltransferase
LAGALCSESEEVKANLERYGDLTVCDFVVGYFDKSLAGFDRPVALAFLDVDLIDSLRPCIESLRPQLQDEGRMYMHEARNLALASTFFDNDWWQGAVGEPAPGFVGAGCGLPLAAHLGSQLGYAQRTGG